MKLTDFIAECQRLAEKIPDAEVLVDGMPIEIAAMPAYYDGASKRYDKDSNTLTYIRSGSKVILRGLSLEDLKELHPGLSLDTSALPEWQAKWYHERLTALRQAPNPSDQRAGASPAPLHQVVGCEPSPGDKSC